MAQMSSASEQAWDANFQAVQDAKAAIVAARVEWSDALKQRSRVLAPLVRKQNLGILDRSDRNLIAQQDAIVRAAGKKARGLRDDLKAARQRFKNAEGC